ncbi:trypsin-1 isoform X2 [Folsomia candida]|uniref:Trypsin-1 n=1 Tax=Folsomia candida TaxID=158441 RepID=A0A226F3P8_FOLCA|nr:trypsin-1 isoform X2 [Folsomia candida]OXA64077.1 Trypsin-1 [Folsomia candida]
MGIRVPRVVHGTSSYSPYQVSLVDTDMGMHFCGGSILNSFIILTAAHCLYRPSRGKELPSLNNPRMPNEIRVVAGQYSLQWPDVTEQTRYVSEFVVHPAYFSILENDIALLQLSEPLNITRSVHPVQLPILDREFKGNITVFGWGVDTMYDAKSYVAHDTLQMGEMSIIPKSRCDLLMLLNSRLPTIPTRFAASSMICGWSNSTTVCKGDSGSGAVCRDCPPPPPVVEGMESTGGEDGSKCVDLLCGINSWGGGKNDCLIDEFGDLIKPPPPAVFTKVSTFVYWISHVLHTELEVKGHFLCDNLQYVVQSRRCDGKLDCLDGSDEQNCTKSGSTTTESSFIHNSISTQMNEITPTTTRNNNDGNALIITKKT